MKKTYQEPELQVYTTTVQHIMAISGGGNDHASASPMDFINDETIVDGGDTKNNTGLDIW